MINKKIILIVSIVCLGFLVIAFLAFRNRSVSTLESKLNLYGDPKKEVSSDKIMYHDEAGEGVEIKNIFPSDYDPVANPIFDIAFEPNKYYVYYEAMGDNYVIRLQIDQKDIKKIREEVENLLFNTLGLKDKMDLCRLPVYTFLANDLKYLGPKSSTSDYGVSYCPGDFTIE